MKYLLALLCLCGSVAHAQLTFDSARVIVHQYRLGYSTYFEPFLEHADYGAPWILTGDGGAAAFGDNLLVRIGKSGKEQWHRRVIPQFNELECQGVAEDKKGNLFVFMLSYDNKRYRGGSERVLCYDKNGKVLWDKTLGAYTVMNNPIISYIRLLPDGKIYLRGHVVTDKPEEGKDPVYRYWEGWLDNTAKLTQKSGDVIDWAKDDWQKKFKPDE
jgi:hypothetical protein